jgi:hypothetical protein
MRSKKISRFLLGSLLFCSLATFLYINFGEQLHAHLHSKSPQADLLLLPDVEMLKTAWETGKQILPKIVLSFS